MKCPEDRVEMRAARPDEGHGGYVCPSCAGAWLLEANIADLELGRPFDATAFHAALQRRLRGTSTWPCPRDGTLLARSEVNGLELDWCPTCRGVWFQMEELGHTLDRHRRYGDGEKFAAYAAADTVVTVLLAMLFG